MTTAATNPHVLGEATLGELEQGLRGSSSGPDDEGYDEARAIWNGAHDRRPALIVRCAGVADVMRAVDFARSEDLLVAVRGGGHTLPGFSTCDGGVVIDLSAMTGVRVDPAAPHGRAEGGCTWARLRPRDAGVRARGHRRARVHHRDRRVHARRRHRLADAQGRPDLRQPGRRRRRHRRRTARAHQRGREPRAAVGPARRRRQLRHRDLARVPAASDRTDAAGRPDLLRRRPRRRGAALLPRLGARAARRADHAGRSHDRSARAVPARSGARQADRRDRRRPRRRARARPRAGRSRSRTSATRSPT